MTNDTVILRDTNNHSIDQYVAGIQEPFGIVTLGTRDQARRYKLEDAVTLIRLADRTSNGHNKLTHEWID